MTNTALRQFLASRNACQSALDWLGDRDSDRMWTECDRPDWLMWWAAHAVPRQQLVFAARAAYAAWAADAANSGACAAAICQLIRTRWPECPLPEVTA